MEEERGQSLTSKSIRLIFSYLVKNIKYRIPPLVPSFPCMSPNGRMSRSKALEEPWIFFKKDDDAVAPLAGGKKVHLPRSAVSIVLATSLRTFTCKTVDSIGGVICRRLLQGSLFSSFFCRNRPSGWNWSFAQPAPHTDWLWHQSRCFPFGRKQVTCRESPKRLPLDRIGQHHQLPPALSFVFPFIRSNHKWPSKLNWYHMLLFLVFPVGLTWSDQLQQFDWNDGTVTGRWPEGSVRIKRCGRNYAHWYLL